MLLPLELVLHYDAAHTVIVFGVVDVVVVVVVIYILKIVFPSLQLVVLLYN